LSDYLDDHFQVERQAVWHWIVPPTPENANANANAAPVKLFNTQGLVLSVLPIPAS
jgi:hypothetical protein